MLPERRQDRLLVEELPEETLVYDLLHHRSHCLNAIATQVWKRCDGRTSVAELAAHLSRQLAIPADEIIVQCALDQLRKARLLRDATPPADEVNISRREVMKELTRYGIAAAMVLSITAPTVAQAASGVTHRQCERLSFCGNQPCTDQPGKRCRTSGRRCNCR